MYNSRALAVYETHSVCRWYFHVNNRHIFIGFISSKALMFFCLHFDSEKVKLCETIYGDNLIIITRAHHHVFHTFKVNLLIQLCWILFHWNKYNAYPMVCSTDVPVSFVIYWTFMIQIYLYTHDLSYKLFAIVLCNASLWQNKLALTNPYGWNYANVVNEFIQ